MRDLTKDRSCNKCDFEGHYKLFSGTSNTCKACRSAHDKIAVSRRKAEKLESDARMEKVLAIANGAWVVDI